MFQPENSFVFRNAMELELPLTRTSVTSLWQSARPLTQRALMSPSFTVEASNKVLKTVDI